MVRNFSLEKTTKWLLVLKFLKQFGFFFSEPNNRQNGKKKVKFKKEKEIQIKLESL